MPAAAGADIRHAASAWVRSELGAGPHGVPRRERRGRGSLEAPAPRRAAVATGSRKTPRARTSSPRCRRSRIGPAARGIRRPRRLCKPRARRDLSGGRGGLDAASQPARKFDSMRDRRAAVRDAVARVRRGSAGGDARLRPVPSRARAALRTRRRTAPDAPSRCVCGRRQRPPTRAFSCHGLRPAARPAAVARRGGRATAARSPARGRDPARRPVGRGLASAAGSSGARVRGDVGHAAAGGELRVSQRAGRGVVLLSDIYQKRRRADCTRLQRARWLPREARAMGRCSARRSRGACSTVIAWWRRNVEDAAAEVRRADATRRRRRRCSAGTCRLRRHGGKYWRDVPRRRRRTERRRRPTPSTTGLEELREFVVDRLRATKAPLTDDDGDERRVWRGANTRQSSASCESIAGRAAGAAAAGLVHMQDGGQPRAFTSSSFGCMPTTRRVMTGLMP